MCRGGGAVAKISDRSRSWPGFRKRQAFILILKSDLFQELLIEFTTLVLKSWNNANVLSTAALFTHKKLNQTDF